MSIYAITWDTADAIVRHRGLFSSSLWHGKRSKLLTWLALLWSALVPNTVATVLQMYGQSRVSAVESQLIYATMPLFNAITSATLLHEKLTSATIWGGGILMLASLMPTFLPLLRQAILH